MTERQREKMTSTIERAAGSLSLAVKNINEIEEFLKEVEKFGGNLAPATLRLTFIKFLLETQQTSLLTYAECIREKRRNARHNKKTKNHDVNNFIEQ